MTDDRKCKTFFMVVPEEVEKSAGITAEVAELRAAQRTQRLFTLRSLRLKKNNDQSMD